MKLTVFLCWLIIMLLPTAAQASACQTSSTSNNAITKVLQRQISALRAIERARGCIPGRSAGGFFNACREVALRINEVKQQMQAGSGLSTACTIERSVALSRTQKPKVPTSSGSKSAERAQQRVKEGDFSPAPQNALQFCVRLSDGYYFPTPNSQYSQKGGIEAALNQCRIICETPDMAVYILTDQNAETSDMVSALTNRSYADLPTAYNYHGEGEFKRCNWNGYVAKIREVVFARRTGRFEAHKAQILKVQQQASMAAAAFKDDDAASNSATRAEVRIIGTAFIPASGNQPALGEH